MSALGGGLASAASAVSGSKATTLNAAGLNSSTVEKVGIDKELLAIRAKNVDAFYTSSDTLNKIQNNIYKVPTAFGNRHEVSVVSCYQHSWLGLIIPALGWASINPVAGAAVGILKGGQMALDGHGMDVMIVNIEN